MVAHESSLQDQQALNVAQDSPGINPNNDASRFVTPETSLTSRKGYVSRRGSKSARSRAENLSLRPKKEDRR